MKMLGLFVVFSLMAPFLATEVRLQKTLCEKYPGLKVCDLIVVAQEAYEQMDEIMKEIESYSGENSVRVGLAQSVGGVQKRKSAFVRFGKRSVDSIQEVVPVQGLNTEEGLLNARPARKSSYIRFG